MNSSIFSIYRAIDVPEEGELTQYQREVQYQLADWPHRRLAAGNYIFVTPCPFAVNPINIETDFVDEDGNPLTGDDLALAIASEMVKPERTRAIQMSKSTASILNRHPIWRLMVNMYGDEETNQPEEDYSYVKTVLPGLPDYNSNMTGEQITGLIFTELSKQKGA
jgi:hypothetical protein